MEARRALATRVPVAVLGATGYTGVELLRLLARHPATAHPAPELLAEAVYGLPELYRARLREARIVACPGCYPTGALLGLVPLARAGLLREPVIIDAKSGATGAGRAVKAEQLFAEVNENFRPYAIGEHRHGPEIDQELRAAGAAAAALFVPHLLPLSRRLP